MLPEVSKEVIAGVVKGVSDAQKVRDSWEAMLENNAILFTYITEVAATIASVDKARGEMFLRGAMGVCETLRVQDEVDEMNRNWG